MLAALGRWILKPVATVEGATQLLFRAARHAHEREPGQIARQAHNLANRSMVFVSIVMVFVGAIMVFTACAQAARLVGDLSIVGPTFLQLLTREFGPSIVALMVAARYGSGVAAELGALAVTEQIDAIRLSSTDPAGYLVAPRLIAGPIGMVPLAVLGGTVAFLTGGYVARVHFGVGWDTYFSTRLVAGADVIIGLAKSVCFGLAVPLFASQAGLKARGGAPAVGRAATEAVVAGSTVVLVLDLVIGAIGTWACS
jgi:phospholipid/cholesterol/gamma-HCH transport system permease protein